MDNCARIAGVLSTVNLNGVTSHEKVFVCTGQEAWSFNIAYWDASIMNPGWERTPRSCLFRIGNWQNHYIYYSNQSFMDPEYGYTIHIHIQPYTYIILIYTHNHFILNIYIYIYYIDMCALSMYCHNLNMYVYIYIYYTYISCTYHRIGWRENLQEIPIFDGKNHGFL